MSKDPITEILASYPRTRPELPPEHQKVYLSEYLLNRDGTVLSTRAARSLESWMHLQVASLKSNLILEVGAGTLNHLAYEDGAAVYDIVEPFHELYAQSHLLTRIRNRFDHLKQIPSLEKYKRVISVAVLEHMENLPTEVAIMSQHLEPDGVFQAGIPSEGGFLWWLGWRMTTGVSYWRRHRLDYGVLRRYEHINTSKEIIAIVKYLFENVTVRRFPSGLHHLSFYAYIEARNPILGRASEILGSIQNNANAVSNTSIKRPDEEIKVVSGHVADEDRPGEG